MSSGPTEYPIASADKFDPETDLQEAIDLVAPADGHVSGESQEETVSYYIPANKLLAAQKWFIGWSKADTASPWKLRRYQPPPHPRLPTLRAYTLSYKMLGPKANTANPNNETYVESNFEGPDGETLYYAGYEQALVTVRYKSFGRMRFLPDADIDDYTDEWKRNMRFTAESQLDQLTADGAPNFKFAEPPTGQPAGTPPDGVPFPVPLAQPLAKQKLVIYWEKVAFEYLSSDPVVLDPVKVNACLGCVNSDTFLGYSPGTLAMFEAPKFEECLFPVLPSDPTDFPFTGYNVTITLSRFDPPKGNTGSTYHGHNLMPYSADGKFYRALRSDGATEMLPAVPFLKMFQHAQDPS